jgi:glucan phosphoethanolaminetransferase (alkaline phosphatase superfamily)
MTHGPASHSIEATREGRDGGAHTPCASVPGSAINGEAIPRDWARVETLLLLLGLLCTGWGKRHALTASHTDGLLAETLYASVSDIAFFAAVAAMLLMLHALLSWRLSTRIATGLSALVLLWAASNSAWLVATGSQIHPSVVSHLFLSPAQFGPILWHGLITREQISIPVLIASMPLAIVVAKSLMQPAPLRNTRGRLLAFAGIAALIAAISQVTVITTRAYAASSPRRAAVSFNSHLFALTSLTGIQVREAGMVRTNQRTVPRAGDRTLVAAGATSPAPDVIMVIMESTAQWATSPDGVSAENYPALMDLAENGLAFENTRARVTHTTQSQFAILTGASPSLDGGFPEAVLVDQSYESLATILKTAGYRSRFCQMVKATFECNPALVANLGFDSFWSREDLGDRESHLGYFSGDDFRMLEPAFAWFDRQRGPVLLVLMTSVPHHPYEVPAWFGPRIEEPEPAYRQALRYQDRFIAAVVENLKKRGAYDNTLLCLVGDHGEGFGAHGVLQHNRNPYDEALRVPWLITWPAGLATRGRITAPCSLLDVTPTLLGLLGYDISRAEFDGLDALQPIDPQREVLFFGWGAVAPAGTLRGARKLIYWPEVDGGYYLDLSRDPAERSPMLLQRSDATSLRRGLNEDRLRYRLSFRPKRYRERFLYERWQTFSLDNVSWCYYTPP